MTTEELITAARAALDFGVKHLIEKQGDLHLQFHIVYRDHIEVLIAGGDVTNSRSAKRLLSRSIRDKIASGTVEGVLMLSDTYWSEDMTPDGDKVRQAMGWDIHQARQNGLCTVCEAVVVVLETPLMRWVARQKYTRSERGAIVPTGEPVIMSDIGGDGNFAGFWKDAPHA